jgi:hypothetical protein
VKRETITVVSRDPFARHDVVRRTVKGDKPCEWCGGPRGRFQYGIHPDDKGRPDWAPGHYCGVSCYRANTP